MRASLTYLTSTSATTVAAHRRRPHRLEVLGYHRGEHAVYLREDVGADVPVCHVVHTRGVQAGRMIPLRSWYDDDDSAGGVAERLAILQEALVPMPALPADAWLLLTRVVQRRALRLPDGDRPIRKYAVQLTVHPLLASDEARSGQAVVTAYLRPRAHLDRVLAVPGEPLAVACVTYVGVPDGVGLGKQVAMLVGRDLH